MRSPVSPETSLSCTKVNFFNFQYIGNLFLFKKHCFNLDFVSEDNETDVINGASVCGRDRSFGPITLTNSSVLVVDFVSKISRFTFSTKQGFRLLFLSAADLSM